MKVTRKLGDLSDISDCLPRSVHSASAQSPSAVDRGWLGKVSQYRTIAIALDVEVLWLLYPRLWSKRPLYFGNVFCYFLMVTANNTAEKPNILYINL